jgi:hypothetical protein
MTEECWAVRGSLTGLDQHIERDIKGEHMPPDLPPKQVYSILISFVELFNIGLKFSHSVLVKRKVLFSSIFDPLKCEGLHNGMTLLIRRVVNLSICMKKLTMR